jgi:hypothetical protein
VCQFVNDNQSFSLFTRALVTALRAGHSARTLSEVITATEAELNRLASKYGKLPQKLCLSWERGVSLPTYDPVICDGPTSRSKSAQALDDWTRSVHNSPLWMGLKDGHMTERLKRQIDSIVGLCRKQFEAACAAFPEDPWVDEYYPRRVVDRLSFLIDHSDPSIKITDAERALLIIAPFLREGILRNGVRVAAQASPLAQLPQFEAFRNFFSGSKRGVSCSEAECFQWGDYESSRDLI